MTRFRKPTSTYRLQLNGDFRFADAIRIVPFLEQLGITDVYSSPLLAARAGSTHGYDVVDASLLNPELGEGTDFDRLCSELSERGMGLLLDVVPNHMAASRENLWWMSLLENGQSSRFAHYFDIDWTSAQSPKTAEPKVLLPLLGSPYGEVLEGRQLQLEFVEGAFFIRYYEQVFPVCPASYGLILSEVVGQIRSTGSAVAVADELGEVCNVPAQPLNSKFLKEMLARLERDSEPFRNGVAAVLTSYNGVSGDERSFDRLDALLEAQWYRLAYWRIASEEINYRRFFDITDLVGVRVEDPEVFEARHSKILELVESGRISGLRIDHIDGLHDPAAYLRRLQNRIGSFNGDEGHAFYVIVEKILAPGEQIAPSFELEGTTGYDFLNVLNSLFIDPEGLEELGRTYSAFSGVEQRFEEIAYRSKKLVLDELFHGEIRGLAARLGRLAAAHRNARDFPLSELLVGLIEVTASLDVYRTYIRDSEPDGSDRRCIERAIDRAAERASSLDRGIFEFLRSVLLVDPPHYLAGSSGDWLSFVMRWQQFTPRVTAKGVEDTAFYLYNRLVSMNEVGGEPSDERTKDAVTKFHDHNSATLQSRHYGLSATSTHDTKRSEDARARINVLSELPLEWQRHLDRWSRLNRSLKVDLGGSAVPEPNLEYAIYQSLIGIWPIGDDLSGLVERMKQFVIKAAREAKVRTSWIRPDTEYENAAVAFVEAVLAPSNEKFLASIRSFSQRISLAGAISSLSQVVLKIGSPGVPDFYQGTELWDFSLVDPDNRRSVDFDARARTLAEMGKRSPEALVRSLVRTWRDGRIKLWVTARGLAARRENAALFLEGRYIPLGADQPRICAFARELAGSWALVLAPRLVGRALTSSSMPRGDAWNDVRIELPAEAPREWTNVFTGERLETPKSLELARAFEHLPVAILTSV